MLLWALSGGEYSKSVAATWFYVSPDELIKSEREVPSDEEIIAFIHGWFTKKGWTLNLF